MSTKPPLLNEITEEGISRLVNIFYARVRKDPILGDVFNKVIKDWPHHLDKIKDFWESIMLGKKTYSGNPFIKHMGLRSNPKNTSPKGTLLENGITIDNPITPAHFARWVELFVQTAQEIFIVQEAERFRQKSTMIASSLQMGMFDN